MNMDDKMEEITDTIAELDITGKFILRRLSQLLDQPDKLDTKCQCESARSLQESQREIDKLKEKVSELEKKEKEKEDTLITALEELERVQAVVDKLQLTIQTDDIKLRHLGDSNRHRVERKDVKRTENNDKETKRADNEGITAATNTPDNARMNEETRGAAGGMVTQTAGGDQSRNEDETPHIHADRTTPSSQPKSSQVNDKRNVVPEVIDQPIRKTMPLFLGWEFQANQQFQAAFKNAEQNNVHLEGIFAMFVIDISASLIPHWNQVRQFYHDYVDGLEYTATKCGKQFEYVAIVTFGHTTGLHLYYTDSVTVMRETFDKLKLGGPSPLSAGIGFGLSGAVAPHGRSVSVNGLYQGVKLILITDGEPTEPSVCAGPDECLDQETARASVIGSFDKFESVIGQVELYTVPVGKANTELLELGTSIAGGKMLDYKSGRQFSRRFYLMYKRNPLIESFLTTGDILTQADMRDLEEIKRQDSEIKKKLGDKIYKEVEGSNLPKLGSRVRRGPDWEFDDQDASGPGTVVGYCRNGGQCYVHWDNTDDVDVYRYGVQGKYDILLTEDIRKLKPGEMIAVGCTVKTGSHWNSRNTEVDQTNIGTVINLDMYYGSTPQAMVQWDNGVRGKYCFEDTPEIVVCDPTAGEASGGMSVGTIGTSVDASNMSSNQNISGPSIVKPVKNKNKNK